MRATSWVVATIAAAVTLAACGSGGSQSGFASKADARCVQASTQEISATRSPLNSGSAAAAQARQIETINQDLDGQLAKLTPPDTDKSADKAFLAKRTVFVGDIKRAEEAAGRNDPNGWATAQKQAGRDSEAAQAAAAKAGLTACAGKLPASEVAAIRQVIVKGETAPAPSDCVQHTSALFLAQHFNGSVTTCEREIVKSHSGRVTVSKVTGAGPQASAEVDESGGTSPPAKLTMNLIKQDGQWKVDSVSKR
jgi:hypothetical protein